MRLGIENLIKNAENFLYSRKDTEKDDIILHDLTFFIPIAFVIAPVVAFFGVHYLASKYVTKKQLQELCIKYANNPSKETLKKIAVIVGSTPAGVTKDMFDKETYNFLNGCWSYTEKENSKDVPSYEYLTELGKNKEIKGLSLEDI